MHQWAVELCFHDVGSTAMSASQKQSSAQGIADVSCVTEMHRQWMQRRIQHISAPNRLLDA